MQIFSHRDEQCKILCTIQYEGSNNGSTENAYSLLKNFIRDEYSAHYLVDDLPVAAAGITQDASVLYGKGIPIGGYDPENQKFFLYNHIRFHIYYNEDSSFSGRRVVKVEAIPFSVQQSSEINKDCPRLVPGRAITSPMYLEGMVPTSFIIRLASLDFLHLTLISLQQLHAMLDMHMSSSQSIALTNLS